jgi:TRAP-type C4-dicarboxylate transport system permease small subunit
LPNCPPPDLPPQAGGAVVVEGVGGDAALPQPGLGAPGRVLGYVAGAMILLMMAVTTADVAGRYFLNAPLFGAFEATETLMGLVIFAGMPLATARREHIAVNFFERVMPRRARCAQAALWDLVCAAIAAAMAWRVWARGDALQAAREVTLQLGIARGLIAWAMAALLAVTAAIFLWAALVALRAAFRR